MDEDKGDPFAGLGWGAEIVSLVDSNFFLILHRKVD